MIDPENSLTTVLLHVQTDESNLDNYMFTPLLPLYYGV